MTTGPSRNRRRRGRRGQRPRQVESPAGEQTTQQDPSQETRRPEPAQEARPPAREARRAREAGQEQGERPAGSARKRSRGKRRPNRRPVITAMPTEVLREEVRDIKPSGKIILRRIEDLVTSDGMTFGCPMLSRTRLGMPFAQGQRVPRCSMGWAIHSEEEALLCMRTPHLVDCWQAHPEREAALRASGEEENAAD